MSLETVYERQERWRRWDEALARVPLARDQRVIDVGCGAGAVAARLDQSGLDVIGVDRDEDLLGRARVRVPNARFVRLDLAELAPSTFGRVDGIWASFVAAYLPELDGFVQKLSTCLRAGGWLALVEVDDLLGHEPRSQHLADEVDRLFDWARAHRGYGFEHGRKLASAMRNAGLCILHEGTLEDDELAFDGAAPHDVLDAWRERLARMRGMQTFFGDRFPAVRDQLVEALSAASHRSLGRVQLVVGRR